MNYLSWMAQAWDDGYSDGMAAAACDAEAMNPYQKLIDDRRQCVRDVIEDQFGPLTDDDDVVILPDHLLDAILDAHDEWLSIQKKAD